MSLGLYVSRVVDAYSNNIVFAWSLSQVSLFERILVAN